MTKNILRLLLLSLTLFGLTFWTYLLVQQGQFLSWLTALLVFTPVIVHTIFALFVEITKTR